MAGYFSFCISGESRWTKQCRVTQGMMWMNRLRMLARHTKLNGRYIPDNFIHGMKDQRVPPHDDCDGVVPHGQAVGRDEQALRLRKDPDTQNDEDVDKVAQVCEKVVVALLVVGNEADGHKVEELASVPVWEVFGVQADKIAGDEDVHDSSDERCLLARRHSNGLFPLLVQTIYRVTHALPVLVELFALGRYSSAPFLDNAILCDASVLGLVLDLLRLCGDRVLELLDALGESEILDKVEHGQPLDGWEEGCFLKVGIIVVGAVGERGRA
jgi:hypothetical protein